MSVERKLDLIPSKPGVYLFKDSRGRIIYVGKAKRLDARVRGHFRGDSGDPRHGSLINRVRDLDYIATQSEIDALILEANLIKQHKPRYNISLRDDKRYPFLKVTLREEYPRLLLTRDLVDDGSRYFGPLTDVKAVRQGVRLLRSAFQLRGCPGAQPGRQKGRECLDYQIGICSAPCTGRVDKTQYSSFVEELLMCLKGQSEAVADALREKMDRASRDRQYEACSRLRDRVNAIDSALRRQRVFVLRDYDSDVFGMARHAQLAAVSVLKVREGKVLGKDTLLLQGTGQKHDSEILSFAMSQYYLGASLVPKEVLIPVGIEEDAGVLSSWLSARASRPVSLRLPRRRQGAALTAMANDNALLALQETLSPSLQRPGTIAAEVRALQAALRLPSLPVKIEAFDISQISGQQAVASVVVYVNGRPRRSDYRRMRIKGVEGQDDFAMMEEAVRRRMERLSRERVPLPDFILVDGGRAQITAATTALAKASVTIPGVIGLAKREETLYFSWRETTLKLGAAARPVTILQRMRDEAHRLAIGYHRRLRARRTISSALDEVEGVGPMKRKALLRRFGSVRVLRRAAMEEIAGVRGIGPVLARRILGTLAESGPHGGTPPPRSASG
ncbi:MAG: excinuclease ABC subunit UvrC [Candidatus Eisenbacteria bacterium]